MTRTNRSLLWHVLSRLLQPVRLGRDAINASKLLREQNRCLTVKKPVPFVFRGKKMFMAPDESAMLHIRVSTEKIARLAQLIPSDASMILDVGAHSGLFSYFAQQRIPSAPVIAFEPTTISSKL